jgi:uncharacterized lipoprotein YmbA
VKSSWTAHALLVLSACAALLCACAARRPDHFYVLSALPPEAGEARSMPTTQATLRVTLPSWADRHEMILDTSTDGVIILEHERWAAPLADLVTQTLARDLERRRGDLLVAAHGVNGSSVPVIKITVDVVQMSVRRGRSASIETHWRIVDPRSGKEQAGAETFSAPLGQDDYAAVAQSLSHCLALLADRLTEQMR